MTHDPRGRKPNDSTQPIDEVNGEQRLRAWSSPADKTHIHTHTHVQARGWDGSCSRSTASYRPAPIPCRWVCTLRCSSRHDVANLPVRPTDSFRAGRAAKTPVSRSMASQPVTRRTRDDGRGLLVQRPRALPATRHLGCGARCRDSLRALAVRPMSCAGWGVCNGLSTVRRDEHTRAEERVAYPSQPRVAPIGRMATAIARSHTWAPAPSNAAS